MAWLYWICVVALAARWASLTWTLWRGGHALSRLDRVDPDGPSPLPRLSIVVPALDEEATVGAAMRTLLALDYPDLEILAVNDRSTDRTGEILDDLAAGSDRLRVVHIRDLPPGWLGKSHALHTASLRATGEWILFTDADVHFEPTALRRAVRHALATGADHLVVLPEVVARGYLEKQFLAFFWTVFTFRWRPSRVSDPASSDHIGIGAFNLVRAEAYRRAGGHDAMRMEVLDDVRLGHRLKASGARQVCIPGGSLVRVRWVEGLGGAVRGITKNLYASAGYNPLVALSGAAMLLAGTFGPFAGLLAGPWPGRLLCALAVGCMVWSIRCGIQIPGLSPLYGLGYPLAAAVFAYAIVRSMAVTHARGGVTWRGTHYRLADLRRGRR